MIGFILLFFNVLTYDIFLDRPPILLDFHPHKLNSARTLPVTINVTLFSSTGFEKLKLKIIIKNKIMYTLTFMYIPFIISTKFLPTTQFCKIP